jgi:hypothetical protein
MQALFSSETLATTSETTQCFNAEGYDRTAQFISRFWSNLMNMYGEDYNFVCGSVWVWNLVSDIKGGT